MNQSIKPNTIVPEIGAMSHCFLLACAGSTTVIAYINLLVLCGLLEYLGNIAQI